MAFNTSQAIASALKQITAAPAQPSAQAIYNAMVNGAAPPQWSDILNYGYASGYIGKGDDPNGINRPWTYDADAIRTGTGLISQYNDILNQYNTIHGTDYTDPYSSVSQLPNTPYQESLPAENKGNEGFFNSGVTGVLTDVGLGLATAGIGSALGLTGGALGLFTGGITGGLTSAINGGNIFTGALEGGVLGGIGGTISGGFGSFGSNVSAPVGASASGLGDFLSSEAAPGFGTTVAGAPLQDLQSFLSADSGISGAGAIQGAPAFGGSSVDNPQISMGSTQAPAPVQDLSSGVTTSGLQGATPAVQQAAITGGAVDTSGSTIQQLLSQLVGQNNSPVKGLMNLASGIYGLNQSNAGNAADPFAAQRAQYQQQLQFLMQNPSSVQQLPGYQAGLDAINRSNAAQGYTGGGKAHVDLLNYGGSIYNQQLQNLMQLAGANSGSPGAAGQILSNAGQNRITNNSAALGSIGSGVGTLLSNPTISNYISGFFGG